MDRREDRLSLRSPGRAGAWIASVWAACLVMAASPPDAAAQSPEASPAPGSADAAGGGRAARSAGPAEGADDAPGRIDGFWGLGWRSDSAAVAERLGPPITVGRQGDGLRFFVYTPLYLGRDGFLQMWLHEEEGLVGASWQPMTSDCGGMLRRLVRATRREHPEVPSRTEGRVTPEMLGGDLCVAALERGAAVTVVWRDSAGTEIRIGTTPGSHRLRMQVLTGALQARRPEGI